MNSKVEHSKGPNTGFNSMLQITKLILQSGQHHDMPLEFKNIANFHTQQT